MGKLAVKDGGITITVVVQLKEDQMGTMEIKH